MSSQKIAIPILFETRLNILSELLLLLILLPVLIIPWLINPNPYLIETHRQLLLPPCPFYHFTKIPCMFCGVTTSFSYLVHGNILKALWAHPVAPLLYILFAFWAINLIIKLLRQVPLTIKVSITLRGILIIIAVIWGLKLTVWFWLKPF